MTTANTPAQTLGAETASPSATSLAPRPLDPLRAPQPGARYLNLSDARSLVERDDHGKWDIIVPRRELTLKNGELEFPIDLGPHDLANGSSRSEASERHVSCDRLSPSSLALGQLCTRLGIPAAYIRHCPPILQDQNLNFWLKAGYAAKASDASASTSPSRRSPEEPGQEWKDLEWVSGRELKQRQEKWLLRARHGTLRAVLSERFSPLDNAALMETLAPLLPPHYQVQWLGLEDESFHLRILDPTRAHEVLPGDDFFVGVHIANSEVGLRSLTVDALVYRLVCSNGLVALVKGKSLLRQRHVHIAAPRFKAALEEALVQALGATEMLLSQLQVATRQVVPDAGVAIKRLARHWHLSESTEQSAKAALLGESSPVQESAYGLVNAFTAAAQLLPDEKRYDLEMLAGSLARHGVPQFALSPHEVTSPREATATSGKREKNGTATPGKEMAMNGGER